MTDAEPRLELRPYSTDLARLDDVVVRDVTMFRAEMLANDVLWLACYLDGGHRVTFRVSVRDGELRLEVEETPAQPG